jgi:hypothetical protein
MKSLLIDRGFLREIGLFGKRNQGSGVRDQGSGTRKSAEMFHVEHIHSVEVSRMFTT